jgi:DNA processing protein
MEVTVVRRRDAAYPPLLAQLHDPPVCIHLRGDAGVDVLVRPCVAVVGARSCSPYGADVARMLGRELAAAGVVVVSGLARGIDGEAHRGALAGDGPTIAVLGCGIDRDYPRSHAWLARRIGETGLLVSEYPPGVEPAPWRFPARNRIIAGLCAATVVVEARERSGALITADFALELGRDVFAVPGEITAARSAGTNHLLRQGAAPLLGVEDVLDAIGVERAVAPTATVSAEAAVIVEALTDAPRGADELARMCGWSSAQMAAALVELELAGVVSEASGVYRCQPGLRATTAG